MTTTLPLAPMPPGLPLIGNLREIARGDTRFQVLAGYQRRYGDLIRLKLGTRLKHVTFSPDAAKHILVDKAKNYPKSDLYEKLSDFLGNGLFTSGGESWMRHRRMMQPHFHLKAVAALVPGVTDLTGAMLEGWAGAHAAPAQPLDVHSEMMALTLRVVAKTLLGTDLTGETAVVGRALPFVLEHTNRRVLGLAPPPLWVPTPNNVAFNAAVRELDRIVMGLIEKRRRDGGEHNDLLAMLLSMRDEESGTGMTDRQLRDEVMTTFLAGHETTANALSWTFYLLSRHPEVERRVVQEINEVLGARVPTFDDMPALRYTTMVIEEAMRLYPPVFFLERQALEDDELLGYRIPAGSSVGVSVFLLHHHPSHWENPMGFDPERFSPERSEHRHRFTYLPFGAGGRMCIGSHLAMLEAKLILAMTLQRYQLSLVSGHPVVPEPVLTLRPKHGLQMVAGFRRLAPAPAACPL